MLQSCLHFHSWRVAIPAVLNAEKLQGSSRLRTPKGLLCSPKGAQIFCCVQYSDFVGAEFSPTTPRLAFRSGQTSPPSTSTRGSSDLERRGGHRKYALLRTFDV